MNEIYMGPSHMPIDPKIFWARPNCFEHAQSQTGYQKRTGHYLRALHVYSIDNFVAFGLK